MIIESLCFEEENIIEDIRNLFYTKKGHNYTGHEKETKTMTN